MDLYVTVNIPDAVRSLDKLAYEQVPFATSLALNRVGKSARDAETAQIFDAFTVRRPAFLKRSVRMQPSSKRDLRVELSIRDPFLVQHEEGGIRRPGDVYGSMPQPEGVVAKRVGVVRGRNSPRGLLERNKRAFVQKMKSGKVGVFVRKGKTWTKAKRGEPRKRLPIDLIFALEREAKLEPRLKFETTVTNVVAREWEKEFGAALAQAIASER